MANVPFNERCYQLLSIVPAGRVTTYKHLAHALQTRAYRAVGNAMHQNPYPRDLVPCHRVVNANGHLGGYAGNIQDKIKRLQAEGVEVKADKIIDFSAKLYVFEA